MTGRRQIEDFFVKTYNFVHNRKNISKKLKKNAGKYFQ